MDEYNLSLNEVVENTAEQSDTRLRILYLYQLLLSQSDEEHPLSTKQITEKMETLHSIHMHRTTVSSDIALLKAAGFEIIGERKRAWEYYLADRAFSIPEIKLLIDAVQSSKFITEKKSEALMEKLISLTSETNASKLQRSIHLTGRAKSDNEKGYYIVDAINDAMNSGVKISFLYFDYDAKKRQILKNDGKPYTVSPYDLIWDGDYYYLTGYCDEREAVRVFRVDRIKEQPELLEESMIRQPKGYSVMKYTQEVFRMFDTQEVLEVVLMCEISTMKFIIDQFGSWVKTKFLDENHFEVNVKVCVGPTFYGWVFGFDGKIKIAGPADVKEQYRERLSQALDTI